MCRTEVNIDISSYKAHAQTKKRVAWGLNLSNLFKDTIMALRRSVTKLNWNLNLPPNTAQTVVTIKYIYI